MGLGLEDRVAEAEGVPLAHGVDARVLLVLVDVLEGLLLAGLLQVGLEAGFGVEVVFDRLLAGAGHEEDVFDTGIRGLANDVLDRGPIDDGQHFLGHRLRDGQEAGSATGRGNDSVHYWLVFI